MEKIINSIELTGPIQWVIAIILLILVTFTTIFFIWKRLRPSKLVDEMMLRTKSWWGMCFVFLFASTVHPTVTYIGLAFLSFFALREIYTLLELRDADRSTLLVCYLSIPIQYYFAYQGWYTMFLIFIPVLSIFFKACEPINLSFFDKLKNLFIPDSANEISPVNSLPQPL